MPVVATHAGYRFGKQTYMLDRKNDRAKIKVGETASSA